MATHDGAELRPGLQIVGSAEAEAPWNEATTDGVIPMFSLASFRNGAYQARITVIAGAPALKGMAQKLEGRYVLCGLERMPVQIAIVVGIGSLVLGGFIEVVLLVHACSSTPRPQSARGLAHSMPWRNYRGPRPTRRVIRRFPPRK